MGLGRLICSAYVFVSYITACTRFPRVGSFFFFWKVNSFLLCILVLSLLWTVVFSLGPRGRHIYLGSWENLWRNFFNILVVKNIYKKLPYFEKMSNFWVTTVAFSHGASWGTEHGGWESWWRKNKFNTLVVKKYILPPF